MRLAWGGLIVVVVLVVSGCVSGSNGAPTSTQAPATSVAPSTSITPVSEAEEPFPQLRIGATALMSLDSVPISGSGFMPGSDVVIAECVGADVIGHSMPEVCDMSLSVPVRVDVRGEFEVTVVVRTVIGTGTRVETDCTQADCVIGASHLAVDLVGLIARLEWSNDAVAPLAPVLTILNLDLDVENNVGTAEIIGTGFTPGSRVRLVQCPIASGGEPGVDGGDCLYDYGSSATANGAGRIAVTATVFPRFQRSSGEVVDCVSSPATCVIADPWPRDRINRMSWVTFEAAPTG